MGLETFIEPRCGAPMYLQDEAIAQKCGKINGYVMSAILSVFIGVFGWSAYKKASPKSDASEDEKSDAKITQYVIAGLSLGIIIVVWLGIPFLSGLYSKRQWVSYEFQIQELMNKGYDQKSAIAQVQSLYQTDVQANAISSLGQRSSGIRINI